jgi:hypothetical protein
MKKPTKMPKETQGLAPGDQLLPFLRTFARQVHAKLSAAAPGEPEDQLKPPIDQLFTSYGKIVSKNLVLKGQSLLKDRLGKPDFAAHDGKLLIGHVELKAPGKGANPGLYKGHDLQQWERFKALPNLIYADGNEWGLYREGKPAAKLVRLSGNVGANGERAVGAEDARDLFDLFVAFTSWTPIVPRKPKELAEFLAPYCRLIREEVLDALKDGPSPLRSLKEEIQNLLFPDASDRQFADAYAQTVIFALLLANMEGADVLDLNSAYETLASHHLLLSRSLQFLTDPQALTEISSSLSLAQRVIHEIQPSALWAEGRLFDEATAEGPWLFFYEHFLAKYDPKLRKAWGVYFTPVEVTRCQVHLIDEILAKHLRKRMGFVDSGVFTLDPALGTATYLMAIIDHALERVEREEGKGAVRGGARSLVNNLHGFEWMVGPYAVAQLRFARALVTYGATLPRGGPGIYLTNTLESPHVKPPAPPLFHQPIAQEHERALKVKDSEHVLICVGNPPYGRHEAATAGNKAVTGGWVRYGGKGERAIFEDFLEPARKAGHGVDLKNAYNLYVYFIRWALWKVFEHKSATGPGIVSFITASSYLDGDAFVGVREHMRRECDHVDIIDLGGEGRGTRKDENVFAIQTPVAIFVAWRKARKDNKDVPATVRYTRIEGSREEKLKKLDNIRSEKNLKWQECPSDWQAPFRPSMTGSFFAWPLINDLVPWQHSGIETKRNWPIAPDEDCLRRRWRSLLKAADRTAAMRDSGDRTADIAEDGLFPPFKKLPAIASLETNTPPQPVIRYAFRSFDRQYLLADSRVISRPRPPLWHTRSEKQLYLTSLFNHPLGGGPALTACAAIPDRHHLRGSYGGKDLLPLYRDSATKQPNILPGLLGLLSREYGRPISPEDLAGYIYALLAQPEYTLRFAEELSSREVRVPLTRDGKLFFKAAEFGKELIWLHTYGERLTAKDRPAGEVPKGRAKCLAAVSEGEDKYPNEFSYDEDSKTLRVGDGRFSPVEPEVFEFEVSGLKVVKSWLGYRMKDRSGKKSSPLDDIRPRSWTHEFTRELLELLWVLEKTIEGYSAQRKLLTEVLAGKLFMADDLPPVPKGAREAPKSGKVKNPAQAKLEF